MGNGAQLEEAPMVENLTDHTIKPKKVKKVVNESDHLRTQTGNLDEGNVIRHSDLKKGQGHKMDTEKKRRILQAKRREHDAKVGLKAIVEENPGIKLGNSVMEVEDKSSIQETTSNPKTVVPVPEKPSIKIAGDEIPVGSQYRADMPNKRQKRPALKLFPVFDYALFEENAGEAVVKDIEHSSAIATGSSFKPTRSPFDQHSSAKRLDLIERSSMKAKIFHNHKSIASELGKYESLFSRREQNAYMREGSQQNPSVHPQHPQEFLMQTPQRGGPPSFLRSIHGGSIRTPQTLGEIEQ